MYRRGPRVAPATRASAHLERGVAFDRLGRTAEAEAAFRAALAADPSSGEAACNLGRMLVFAGDIAGAAGWFERAVAREPHNALFHWCLVDSRRGDVGDAHLAQMERLACDLASAPAEGRAELHFALASAHERRGNVTAMFRHLQDGNALKRATLPYDETARMRFFDSLTRLCTPAFMEALRGAGHPSERPIFIFGMPRSGTTLVEQLLAGHPAIVAGGELDAFELAVNAELLEPGMRLAGLRDRMRRLGERYVRDTDGWSAGAAHVTDKLTHNFCFAPFIHLALPNARMIHVRRDPIDTCFSCYATNFAGPGLAYTYELGALGRYYAAYERVMAAWRRVLPPDRFIEVDYERLVDDFDVEAQRIVAFCGLPWSPELRSFHTVRRDVRTASAVEVRRPLYRDSLGRARAFAAHLAPLRDALGR
jgi:tetratricopeptide (TPR) repeat protein